MNKSFKPLFCLNCSQVHEIFTQGRDGCVCPLWSLKYHSWFPATDSSENFDWQRLMLTTPSPAHMCRSVSGPHLNTIENSWNNNRFSLLTLNRVFLIHLSLKTSLFSNKTLPLIATDICQNFNFWWELVQFLQISNCFAIGNPSSASLEKHSMFIELTLWTYNTGPV